MKQEIMMWAVINNVTQEVATVGKNELSIHHTRRAARHWLCFAQDRDNTAARVRRVKVTIEEAA